MKYVEVAVNAPTAWPRTFTYALLPDSPVETGFAVWVPFGKRFLQGVVFDLTEHPSVEETRPIDHSIGLQPLLTVPQVALARWIGEYYHSSYFDAAALMLPPAFEQKTRTFLEALPDSYHENLDTLPPLQKKMLGFLQKGGRTEIRQMKKAIPQRGIENTANQLVRRGLISKTMELEQPRVRAKMESLIRLTADLDHAQGEIATLEKRKASKQVELLKMLIGRNTAVPLSEIRERLGPSSTTALKSLSGKGIVSIDKIRIHRDPLRNRHFAVATPPQLTPSQEAAWSQVRECLENSASSVFLLHGVTGSGKTEIYLRALQQTISQGKKAIVLVPEIALTPQTIARFASRFPERVAVLHSKLSLGEQFDEWHRIRDGEFDVVIGSRSALFAPQPDLGLIVIDEEHEWTYKQTDRSPRYHARNAALKLAELVGAVVILGSATPDLESYHRAQRGDYRLLELPERVGEIQEGAYPRLSPVEVVDLRKELKSGNRSIFSRSLHQAISNALDAKEQVILFLNRRGTSSFVQCRDCGHVMHCRRCEMALTYHAHESHLICHQCNYRVPPPTTCPECWGRRIKFLGIGTQKVEEETALTFPQARILRWDHDATRGKFSHEEILRKYQSHEADILIGTQMIAKGLDIPLVTLVGVINADIGLYLPDFRAGERTFQILSQVAGRAGRGIRSGRVIIQTYATDHYAIIAAARQDYRSFYQQEIAFRHHYGNPPFNRLASMVYTHTNAERCREEAERMVRLLREERDSQGLANTALIGPVPAYAQRVRGRYRWQVIIRSPDPVSIIAHTPIPQGWTVDIDPVGLT